MPNSFTLTAPACRYGELKEVMVGGGEDGGECYIFAQFK